MKGTLMLLGACLFAPLAGALAGNSLNTTPLQPAGDPLATIPRHESDFTGNIAFGGFDIPDHYPLVTRHGTIPVEELTFHGRLRGQDIYAPREPDAGEADVPATDNLAPTPDDGELQRAADVAGLVPVAPSPASRSAVMAAPDRGPAMASGGAPAALATVQ
jgi:hypothetical protein